MLTNWLLKKKKKPLFKKMGKQSQLIKEIQMAMNFPQNVQQHYESGKWKLSKTTLFAYKNQRRLKHDNN